MDPNRARQAVMNLLVCAGVAYGGSVQGLSAQDETPESTSDAASIADPDQIEIGIFSEPLELEVLVEFVAEALGIDITVQGELTGEVSFVAPRTIDRADLLPLLERLLDQNQFALMYDAVLDRYLIRPGTVVSGGAAGSEFATTRIIATPNIRPSSLTEAINAYDTGVGGVGQVSYLDDLSVIVVTGPPIRARELEAYIQSLLDQARKIEYLRIPLKHISASAARERAIALATGSGARSATARQPNVGNNQPITAGSSNSFDNLADRLIVESHSNALILRGLPEEAERVKALIELIDQPTNLSSREFFAGSMAAQVARIASGLGLGELIEIDDQNNQQNTNPFARQRNLQNQLQNQNSNAMQGGSRMIVDAERGRILHYGTTEQQLQLEDLVLELKADGERIVIREYKLENALAETIADLLQALVDGGNDQSDGTLLPGTSRPNQINRAQPNRSGGGEGAFTARAEDVYVGFFEPQNMVLVKAPAQVQSQFAELIDRLDQRSPQVFLDVQIVSVTNTENFRFAVESQIIAGQYGYQTNYGLSNAGDAFLDRRLPEVSLAGLTTALIRSEAMPFIINAIETKTDGKVISRPQLLVNDNAEASIVSEEQQPTTSTSQGDGSTVTSFDGFESAGTMLRVRPVISSGGYVKLEYEIELSNFIGTGGNGVPAPKTVRNVSADAITVPGDATIVVGGISVSDFRKERTGIPWLMDIPLLGALVSDTTDISSESLLYIFITPRIMRDENFQDLRLNTAGPQSEMEIDPDIPDTSPVFMESIGIGPLGRAPAPRTPVVSELEASKTISISEEPVEWPDQKPTMMTPVADPDR